MLYLAIFDAKEEVSITEIEKEREEWINKGKDRIFQERCRTISRYEVLGKWPLMIIFVIETDDPTVLNLLTHHFGEAWESISYPIIQRQICEALKDDLTIIGG